jgi:hypothetical protein
MNSKYTDILPSKFELFDKPFRYSARANDRYTIEMVPEHLGLGWIRLVRWALNIYREDGTLVGARGYRLNRATKEAYQALDNHNRSGQKQN